MTPAKPTFTLLAGGDVGPIIQPVDRLTELIRPVLDQVDFRFGQCERTYSDRGSFPQWTTSPKGQWSRLPQEYATVFKAARIDVASVASNHALDWGVPPLLDTIALFRSWGMQVVGGGADEQEARRPALLEKDGVTVALLAYCSVLREGQGAGPGHPGVAAIRVRTSYEHVDFQPASPPLIRSEAIAEDVRAMERDIRAARDMADTVVVSMHWGIRHVPKVLAEYQVPLAHAAMDAGADVILGHHPHVPKAVESYGSSTCFYSIGNFLATGRGSVASQIASGQPKELVQDDRAYARWNIFWYERYDENSLYGFPADCRQAVLPKITFSTRGVERIAMVPVFMNELAQPEPLRQGDERFDQVLRYMEWVSDQFPHRFRAEGDEIVLDHDTRARTADAPAGAMEAS